jgi:hypothetical protein
MTISKEDLQKHAQEIHVELTKVLENLQKVEQERTDLIVKKNAMVGAIESTKILLAKEEELSKPKEEAKVEIPNSIPQQTDEVKEAEELVDEKVKGE